MESKNYYDILEVSVKASAQEITLAKNKLAKRYHPDVNMRNGIDTTDKMQEILEATLFFPIRQSVPSMTGKSVETVLRKCRHLISMKNLKKLKTQIILHLLLTGKQPVLYMTSSSRATPCFVKEKTPPN